MSLALLVKYWTIINFMFCYQIYTSECAKFPAKTIKLRIKFGFFQNKNKLYIKYAHYKTNEMICYYNLKIKKIIQTN